MKERLLDALTPEVLASVRDGALLQQASLHEKLAAQATQHPDQGYENILDVIFEETKKLADQDQVLIDIVYDPSRFESWYSGITESEAFLSAANKDQKALPRILAMIVLSDLCISVTELVSASLPQICPHGSDYLNGLQERYNGYLKDAFEYARNGEKKVTLTGQELSA